MKQKRLFLIFSLFFMTLLSAEQANAQNKQIARIAKIEVDPAQVDAYYAALKEQMHAAIKEEPGVLSFYAVAEKDNPSHITIFEIYADSAAYNAHILTAHFKKYKATVKDMVKSLQLVDVNVIGIARKPGM